MATELAEPAQNIEGIYAYILSGWKCLQNFLGPAAVSVMREMGLILSTLLNKTSNINTKNCGDVETKGIIGYTLCVCRMCLIPVKEINIRHQNNELTIEFVEDENINVNQALKQDDAWKLLPFPMLSLLYYLLNKHCEIPASPTKFCATYENNKWIYNLTFAKAINLNCTNILCK